MKTYLAEWMVYHDTTPRDISKQTGIPIDRIHKYISGKKINLIEADAVSNILGITIHELIHIHPLEQYPFYTQRLTTSSFKEMLRLRKYFQVTYPHTDWSIRIYDDWTGRYRYEFTYCRDFPFTIHQLHRITHSKKYHVSEEAMNPIEVFEKLRLQIVRTNVEKKEW